MADNTPTQGEKLIRDVVRFVLSHYEQIDGKSPFQPVAVDPAEWWSKMQLLGHDPEKLRPVSAAHLEARIARWQEIAVERFGE